MKTKHRTFLIGGLLAGALALGCQTPPLTSLTPRSLVRVGTLAFEPDASLGIAFHRECGKGRAAYALNQVAASSRPLDPRIARIKIVITGTNLIDPIVEIIAPSSFNGQCDLTLSVKALPPGTYNVVMNGLDANGKVVSHGENAVTITNTTDTFGLDVNCDFDLGKLQVHINCCNAPTPSATPTATPTPVPTPTPIPWPTATPACPVSPGGSIIVTSPALTMDAPLLPASLNHSAPQSIAKDSLGNVFVGLSNVNGQAGFVYRLPANGGTPQQLDWPGGNGHAPSDIAVDAQDNVYVLDAGTNPSPNGAVHKFEAGTWTRTAIATGLYRPLSLAFDSHGWLYVSENLRDRVVRLDPSSASPPFEVYALDAQKLRVPAGIAFGPDDTLYVANNPGSQSYIVRVPYSATAPANNVEYFVGNCAGILDGSSTQALFTQIEDLAVDENGDVIAAEFWGKTLRKINTRGEVSTIGVNASLNQVYPHGVFADTGGKIYVTSYLQYPGGPNLIKLGPVLLHP